MQIYLLRHGEAESASAGPDEERALTPHGRDQVRRVLRRARDAGLAPALVLVSPLRRAAETAALAVEVLGARPRLLQTPVLLPNNPPEPVWDVLRARIEPQVLCVGHEPLLGKLAAYLLGAPAAAIDTPKAALARLDVDLSATLPQGILRWLITPELVGPPPSQ